MSRRPLARASLPTGGGVGGPESRDARHKQKLLKGGVFLKLNKRGKTQERAVWCTTGVDGSQIEKIQWGSAKSRKVRPPLQPGERSGDRLPPPARCTS